MSLNLSRLWCLICLASVLRLVHIRSFVAAHNLMLFLLPPQLLLHPAFSRKHLCGCAQLWFTEPQGQARGRGWPCSQHIIDGGFPRQSYWPNRFPATLLPIDALLELVSCSLSMDTACDTWQVCITPVPRDALDPRTF